MKQEIIETTYELVDEMKSSVSYKRLLELHDIVENNGDIKVLVERFKKANAQYDEVKKYGGYHPDLKNVQRGFSEAKKTLYEHPIVAEYKQLEQLLQKQLDHISATIATSISTKIKHPNELGFMQK